MCSCRGSKSYRARKNRDLRKFRPDNPQRFPQFCGKPRCSKCDKRLVRNIFARLMFCDQLSCGYWRKINGADRKRVILSASRKSRKYQVSVMPLSPQLQKLCQQAEREKDFRKLLSLVSQINHVLKSQPQPKEMLRSSMPKKQTR